MELLLQELKKIWQPILLAVLVILGLLYFFLFSSYFVQHFSNSSTAEASFELSSQWADKYSTTIEAEERAEMEEQLVQEQKLFAERMSAFDEPKQYGFADWDSFAVFCNKHYEKTSENDGETDMEIESVIWKIINGTNYYTIQTLLAVMDSYDKLAENIPPDLNYDGYDDSAELREKNLSRIDEIKSSSLVHGYLPSGILGTTNSYAKHFAVWSVLSVILLLAPTIVRDRLRRTRCMQWSSRKGRHILNTQFAAALLSAVMLSFINFIAYAVPFLMQHPLIFKDFTLFSFQIFRIPWFDWTYGQYLLIVAMMISVLAVSAGGLIVFLSQYSTNYVAMLLKALPLMGLLTFVCSNWIVEFSFFTGNTLSSTFALPGAELIAAGLIAALSAALCAISCHRQRQRELHSS